MEVSRRQSIGVARNWLLLLVNIEDLLEEV